MMKKTTTKVSFKDFPCFIFFLYYFGPRTQIIGQNLIKYEGDNKGGDQKKLFQKQKTHIEREFLLHQ
jgi:hypothetical protein